MYTFARYRTWLDKRTNFHVPQSNEQEEPEPDESEPTLPPIRAAKQQGSEPARSTSVSAPATTQAKAAGKGGDRIEIEPVEEFEKILKKP
jgi:hypothetical protein